MSAEKATLPLEDAAPQDPARGRESDAPGSLLGIKVRGGRARRFPVDEPAEPVGAAQHTPPAAVEAPPAFAEAQALPSARAVVRDAAPGLPRGLAERPAPVAGALLAQWRGWRNGGRLPALGKVEGRMAALCPGGVLLAVSGGRVEVAKRLAGEAPEVDLAALEWMRAVARDSARRALPRHELDEEAGLGLVALPFALETGEGEAAAVLCRIYALEPAGRAPGPQEPPNGGFLSGVIRRLTGT